MEHKLLYMVAIIYQKPPTEKVGYAPRCHQSLQLGYTMDECIEAARAQEESMRQLIPGASEGWAEVASFAELVTPEEIERLNREAGAVAVMMWPDLLDEK